MNMRAKVLTFFQILGGKYIMLTCQHFYVCFFCLFLFSHSDNVLDSVLTDI